MSVRSANLELQEHLEILGKSFELSVPKGTIKEQRSQGIMSAPEPEEDETRLVYEADGKKLVVFSCDLHAFPGKDFGTAAAKLIRDGFCSCDKDSIVSQPTLSKSGLRIINVVPKEPAKQNGETFFVHSAFIVHTDGLVRYVSFYANPVAAKHWANLVAIGDQIFDSIVPISKTSRIERLVTFSGIKVTVPPGIASTLQAGSRLRSFALGEASRPGKCTTEHDYLCRRSSHVSGPNATKGCLSTILGKRVYWTEQPSTNGSDHRLQALIAVPGDDQEVLHIVINGRSDAELALFQKISESLKIDTH